MSAPEVQRYLRLAAHDVRVLALLRRAAAADPTRPDVSDWEVTLLFYVACIHVKAVARCRGRELQDHVVVKQWLNTTEDLVGITKPYRELEERSRDARYEGARFEASTLHQTLAWFNDVRDHLFSLLRGHGETQLPDLNAAIALGL